MPTTDLRARADLPLWRAKLALARQVGLLPALSRLLRIGLWTNLKCVYGDAYSRAFDRKFGVDTSGMVHRDDIAKEAAGSHGAQGHDFQSVPARTIRRALARPPSVEGFIFIDYGCGKGRPLLLAMALPFRRIIGVEHSGSLTEIAKQNILTWRGRRRCAAVEAICADALEYEPPLTPLVLYFAGPFADKSLYRPVMERLKRSLETEPRPVFILYVDARIQTPPTTLMAEHGFSRVPGQEACFDLGATRDKLQFVLYGNQQTRISPSRNG